MRLRNRMMKLADRNLTEKSMFPIIEGRINSKISEYDNTQWKTKSALINIKRKLLDDICSQVVAKDLRGEDDNLIYFKNELTNTMDSFQNIYMKILTFMNQYASALVSEDSSGVIDKLNKTKEFISALPEDCFLSGKVTTLSSFDDLEILTNKYIQILNDNN